MSFRERLAASRNYPRGRTFKHELLPIHPVRDEIIEGQGRKYYLDDGTELWSVTTTLGKYLDQSWKDRWIASVGEEKAKQVSKQATNRGSAVHNIAERYVLNEEKYGQDAMPFALDAFHRIRGFLDENVELIYGIEHPLFSKELKIAGRTDLIATWRGRPAIVDFKTSKREKLITDIDGYFLQAACYSIMTNEMYGIQPVDLAILISADDGRSHAHVAPAGTWEQRVRALLAQEPKK